MVLIKKSLDVLERLKILSQDSRYDLACACARREDEYRRRSKEDKWIYPVALGDGRPTFLFKTLLSNHCINNCRYCPLRVNAEVRRCSLSPEELSKIFLSYYRAGRVRGLFLSSGVVGDADSTMERINRSALLLRRMQFKGYIHLKIIPGASDVAIRQSLTLASAVSLNIETAGENNFKTLSTSKDYGRDIIRPIQFISSLIRNTPHLRYTKYTTQFVVGASSETDREIVNAAWKLYKELGLNRVYFSAYQRGVGSADLPGEHSGYSNKDLLMREHRLYQVDWLIRKYGFSFEEVPFEADGQLSLAFDPKELWARRHPEFFPVNINKDPAYRLFRVPGLGQLTVARIYALRKQGLKINSLQHLVRHKSLLEKAAPYVVF